MARDYKGSKKKARSTRRRKPDRFAGLKFGIAGFALGVVVAAAMYYYLTPTPVAPSAAPAQENPPTVDRSPVQTADTTPSKPLSGTSPDPIPDPTPEPNQADQNGEKKRYPFWDWLIDYEVILPEKNERLEPVREQRTVEKSGTYLLQVGAFRRFADADTRKAEVGLLGIESQIHRVEVDDTTVYRVRIGPTEDLAEVNGLLSKLAREKIEVLLISITN